MILLFIYSCLKVSHECSLEEEYKEYEKLLKNGEESWFWFEKKDKRLVFIFSMLYN